MNRVRNRNGFTIVELMLAMAFVSALLLAIAMTVVQMGNIYNKGVTFKSVNQAGGNLASELQRDINATTPFDLASASPDYYIPQDWGGRLCIGQFSYIWNYGKNLGLEPRDESKLNVYSSPKNTTPINFIKVSDPTGSYCNFATTSKKTITFSDAAELLDSSQSNLAIHSFAITSNAYDGSIGQSGYGQRLYNISFLIGTNDQEALSSDSTTCLLEDNAKSDPVYCAVNQFDIVARAGNNASE